MSSEEIAKFINAQIEEPSRLYIEAQAVSGTGDTQTCFSSGNELLYIMLPYEASVENASLKIQKLLEK